MNNAASRKSIRVAEKAAKRDELADRDAIIEIMRTTQGRAWMWRKLTLARIFDDPFSGEALIEAYHKGVRSFGMTLLADIMAHCPDEYITMTREANVRRITDSNNDDAAGSTASGEQPGSSNAGRDVEGRSDDDSFHRSDEDDDYGNEDRTVN